MKSIVRILELSLFDNGPSRGVAGSERRRQNIAALPAGLTRTVALGIDNLARHHRPQAERTLNALTVAIGGLHYLGSGATAIAYRHDGHVVKIYPRTMEMSETERADYRDVQQARVDRLREHLGPLVTPQQFSIGVHPLGKYRAVMGAQPFVAGSQFDLFQPYSGILERQAIDDYRQRHPTGQQQLNQLVDGTFACAAASATVPDITGTSNFRVMELAGTLHLIDVVPVSNSEQPEIYSSLLRQTEVLGKFLAAA